jgi:hypothetical protein
MFSRIPIPNREAKYSQGVLPSVPNIKTQKGNVHVTRLSKPSLSEPEIA